MLLPGFLHVYVAAHGPNMSFNVYLSAHECVRGHTDLHGPATRSGLTFRQTDSIYTGIDRLYNGADPPDVSDLSSTFQVLVTSSVLKTLIPLLFSYTNI